MHVYVHIYIVCIQHECVLSSCINTHTHKHTHTHIYTQTHAHIYTHTQTHAHIYTHSHTHTHTHKHTHTHTYTHTHTHIPYHGRVICSQVFTTTFWLVSFMRECSICSMYICIYIYIYAM